VEVGDREGVGELVGTRRLQLVFEFPTKAGTTAFPTIHAILLGIQGANSKMARATLKDTHKDRTQNVNSQ